MPPGLPTCWRSCWGIFVPCCCKRHCQKQQNREPWPPVLLFLGSENLSVREVHPVKVIVQILHGIGFCGLGKFKQQALVFGKFHGVTSRRCDGNASSLSPAYPSFCIGRAKSRV